MDPRALRQPVVAVAGLLVVLTAVVALLAAGGRSQTTARAAPKPKPELRIHRRAPSGGPAVAAVPDVRGRSLDAAEAILRGDRFRIRVVRRRDPASAPDAVLDERPSAGTLVAPEVTILLIANASPTTP